MSLAIKDDTLPHWMRQMIHPPSDSFELEISRKISPYLHYPGPIHNIGGIRVGSNCRVPGVQPVTQTIVHRFGHATTPRCLARYCFDYGNARFPPKCECNQKYDCSKPVSCSFTNENCPLTCASCNHNSNVIFY